MKILESRALLVSMAAGAMMAASCSHDTNLYDPNYESKEYQSGWTSRFGEIDAEQNWNTAEKKQVTVTTQATSEVSIYTKGMDQSYLLGQATVSGEATFSLDVPATLQEVYVIAIDGQGQRQVQTLKLSGNDLQASFSTASQARRRAAAALQKPEKVYAVGYNLFRGEEFDSWNRDFVDQINYGNPAHEIYKSWNSEVYATTSWANDLSNADSGQAIDMAPYRDIQDDCSNLYIEKDDDITLLYPYTKDFRIVTASAGPVSLVGIYRNTAGSSSLVYYYVPKGATESQLKSANKYVLIPNTENVVGKQYDLVYYGIDGTQEATLTFPANVEIHFALVVNPAPAYKWKDWTSETGDVNVPVMRGNHWAFSDEALNTEFFDHGEALNKSAATKWTSMSSAAVYTYHKATIVSFEDWGGQFHLEGGVPVQTGNPASVDWNDIAFTLVADLQTTPPGLGTDPDDGKEDVALSWIVACEDLGSRDDYDFNDIVFSVSHVAGQTQATVTPLAAGGIYPAHIWLGERDLGEVHDLIQPGIEPDADGNFDMLNTSGSKGTPGEAISVNVAPDFSLAYDSQNNANMGGFAISVTTPTAQGGQKAVTIGAPTKGSAPQMILVPSTWAWPLERHHVEEAYPLFKNWSQSASQNTTWYDTVVSTEVVH